MSLYASSLGISREVGVAFTFAGRGHSIQYTGTNTAECEKRIRHGIIRVTRVIFMTNLRTSQFYFEV